MEWPKDYWPPKDKRATKKDWEKSISMFNRDLKELQKIVRNPKADLYKRIAHGKGQTIRREALLVADHNAYHLGELVLMQRVIGTWEKR